MRNTIILLVSSVLATTAIARQAPVDTRLSMAERLDRIEAIINNQQQLDMGQQLEAMQGAVQQLQGKFDEIEHQLDLVAKRQRSLFADIDRRLSQNSQTSASTPAAAKTEQHATDDHGAFKERDEYQKAYHLLQEKKYHDAVAALKAYIKKYPQGVYTANAYYWLGEVYHLEGQLDKAKEAFKTVVDNFPKHQKAADALLKLGYVYSAIGDRKQAVVALEDVTHKYKGSSLAHLADARLKRLNQRM